MTGDDYYETTSIAVDSGELTANNLESTQVAQTGGTMTIGNLVVAGLTEAPGSLSFTGGEANITECIANDVVEIYNAGGEISIGHLQTSSSGPSDIGAISFYEGTLSVVSMSGQLGWELGDGTLPVSGTVDISGSSLNVSIEDSYTPPLHETWTLIHATSEIGTFWGLAEGATFDVDGYTFQISYVGGAGHDVTLTRTA